MMRATTWVMQTAKYYESLKLKSYKCPAGIPTIGYGHTRRVFFPGMVITEEQALTLLEEDIAVYEAGVNRLLTREVTQGQFDALVDFAFNVGLDEDTDNIAEGLGDSTLLRLVNEGQFRAASDEFSKWNKARVKGKMTALAGLAKRRIKEKERFLS